MRFENVQNERLCRNTYYGTASLTNTAVSYFIYKMVSDRQGCIGWGLLSPKSFCWIFRLSPKSFCSLFRFIMLCSILPISGNKLYPDDFSEDGTWLFLLLFLLFLLNFLPKEWQWNSCLFTVFILLLPLARNVHAHFPPGFVGEHAFIRSRVRKIECYVWRMKCI